MIADLGRRARQGAPFVDLASQAVRGVAAAAGTPCALLVQIDGDDLRPLALHGWTGPMVGRLLRPDRPGSGVLVPQATAGAAGVAPKSLLAVPLAVRGSPWAVLALHGSPSQRPQPDIAHHLEIVAHILSGAWEARLAEDELAHLAFHDPLTGLANRAMLVERLASDVARGRRDGRILAVVSVDVDRFKVINDSLGHQAGDGVLTEMAARLARVAGPDAVVARVDGDEFAVLLDGVDDEAEGLTAAERIRSYISGPMRIGERDLVVTVTAGVVLGRPGATAEDLLRDVDAAVYQAKAQGRARTAIFEPPLRDRLVRQLDLETALRRALACDELLLHYQPILELSDGTVHEAEALVRWADPERGLISPADFIPVAEDSGLIVPLGAWVLEEACRQARRWGEPGAEGSLAVAVNLSGCQITDAGLVRRVARALDAAHLDPRRLVLEITESVVMTDAETAIVVLRNLKELGVALSIDDFGTGYSSLAYLKRFPVDSLKIDRSFVAGLGVDPDDSAIVGATIRLADALGLATVAEGVENECQRDELRRLGCTRAQGYLFARPGTAEALVAVRAARSQAAHNVIDAAG